MAKVYLEPIYRVTCWKCKTISDFDYKDIQHVKYGPYSEYWKDGVECPVCGAFTALVLNDQGDIKPCYDNPAIDIIYDLEKEVRE